MSIISNILKEERKMSKNFTDDLKKVYELVGKKQKILGDWFKIVENKDGFEEEKNFIDTFLKKIGLECDKENRLSALTRLIALRDEQLVQSLLKEGFSEEKIEEIKEIAYLWVKEFYLKHHADLIKSIKEENLLSEFYIALLEGVHKVGIKLSDWQSSWTRYIINIQNKLLEEKFKDEAVKFLADNNLFDMYEDGSVSDRSYSVIEQIEDKFEVKTYAEFFDKEVKAVVKELDSLIEKLSTLEDCQTNQKEAYIEYFKAIKDAFSEKDRSKLVKKWQDVDRAWMRVTSPIQVGHPLEYYEDHYRKAVALEWDVRISNPKNIGANKTYKNILYMYNSLFEKINHKNKHVLDMCISNLNRVGLYIGRPALYYAAEFNGLFSAQVVPNDEQVTKEMGKKIFAFSDNILDSLRAKPFLKIQNRIFGKEFMDHERELIFKKPEIWHKVYEVSTIGHEYGHILWLDSDSESRMNKSGVFKNIEEFKATTGGLMAFFMNEDEEIKEYILSDLIKRAVGLIAWMQTGEVEPYYCEGLIHLSGLFETKVLSFDGENLKIKLENYDELKNWYIKTYTNLATHYLDKLDANLFLEKYAKKENGVYKPSEEKVRDFVDFYWSLHQSMGRIVDDEVKKEDWL
ncbi:invasion protein CiaB [Sulfurospirillum sp. 1307]|jgi:hypothetical protein